VSILKSFISLFLVLSLAASTANAGSSGKNFMMSVIYGTLAGTLIGAATLAFTSSPSGNLNNVARGASYGLYGGILMGLYINSMDDEEDTNVRGEQGPGQGDEGVPPEAPPPGDGESRNIKKENLHLAFKPFLMAPPIEQPNAWGYGVNFVELKF
jgi:hypothetical protein